jgi:uncharacterized protein YbaP (TraB family)
MRHRIITLVPFLFAAALWAAPPATTTAPATSTKPAKAMVWTFRSPTATIHVMGSLHLATKEIYPLAPEIEAAFKESKSLVVEALMDAEKTKEAQAIIQKGGLQPEGKYLTDSLDAKQIFALRKLCGKANINFENIDAMKPWLAAITLEVATLKVNGFDQSQGVDTHFLNLARQRKMKIMELESLKFQFELITSLSDKEQAMFLQSTMKNAETARERVAKIQAAWIAGDIKNLDEAAGENATQKASNPTEEKLTRMLVTDRNIAMADKIETFLKGNETLFVIIGEGHLGGEKGVLNLLKQKGHAGEQMSINKK